MQRPRLPILALLAALAIAPAAAYPLLFPSRVAPCFSFGGTQYRITSAAEADYRIRIEDAGAPVDSSLPDMRVQLVDAADDADLVLIDESAGAVCTNTSIRTIRVDAAEPRPDLTVRLSREPADHKLYVRSASFSQHEAAGLFAVLWQQPHARIAARMPVTPR